MAGAQSRQQTRWQQGKKATALSLSRQTWHINVSLRWKYSSWRRWVSVRSHLRWDSDCYDCVLNNMIRYFKKWQCVLCRLKIHIRMLCDTITSDKITKFGSYLQGCLCNWLSSYSWWYKSFVVTHKAEHKIRFSKLCFLLLNNNHNLKYKRLFVTISYAVHKLFLSVL